MLVPAEPLHEQRFLDALTKSPSRVKVLVCPVGITYWTKVSAKASVCHLTPMTPLLAKVIGMEVCTAISRTRLWKRETKRMPSPVGRVVVRLGGVIDIVQKFQVICVVHIVALHCW